MRFPSRPMLTASVMAALAASAGTVVTMPDSSADAVELTSDVAAAPGLTPAAPPAASAAGPPVSGAQIAGLALAPARDRATALAAERAARAAAEAAAAARAKAEAEQQARRAAQQKAERKQPRRPANADWEKFRRELKQACDDGRIRGQICRAS